MIAHSVMMVIFYQMDNVYNVIQIVKLVKQLQQIA